MGKRCKWDNCCQKITTVMTLTNTCRCGEVYCSLHRLPENHNCKCLNEFATEGRALLEKKLVKIEPDKVVGIRH